MDLIWYKWTDKYGLLHGIDLGHAHFDNMEGVYIIWDGVNSTVVRVGQGVVKDRLAAHRKDQAINRYSNLIVTWASVPIAYRDGVERFLANHYKPKVGDAFPNVRPIAVNLPQ